MDLTTLLISGAIAGTLAGLLGIGGGIVIVPIVTLLFENQGLDEGLAIKMALGTSLATIIVTAITSI
ncbi:TSUP family transporter, partial [Kaarinaea lacus]